jgi:glucose/arabinose dehydrogenase
MDYKNVACIRVILATLGVAYSVSTLAQSDDNLPTLKLDRIAAQPAFSGQTRAPAAGPSNYRVEVLASGLSAPWALAFLPDGNMLVTENTGAMKIVDNEGQVSSAISGLPEMSHEGWAGLFDVVVDPDFAVNQNVYFSYVANSDDTEPHNVPRVARAKLDAHELKLSSVQVIVDGFGGQELHFAPDGTLLVSGSGDIATGDAQDLGSTVGKLLRINRDGTPALDNPFVAQNTARQEILTYGHRDISGMATEPASGAIWITEHGPRGGDELNRIRSAANYGWKVISYGTDYNGDSIGSGKSQMAGMEQPVYFWRPSIAPSGLVFYSGSLFPEWRNNIFVTSLSGQHLVRLVLEDGRVLAEERMLVDRGQRLREARQGPDGALYLLTNEESGNPKGTAELLRISRQ